MDKAAYTYPDGARYDGEWQNGKRHGKGIWTRPDGMKYDGEWKDDKPEGYGKLTASDGSLKEGYWKQGKFVGKGQRPALEERVKELEQDVQFLKQGFASLKDKQPGGSFFFSEKQEEEQNHQNMSKEKVQHELKVAGQKKTISGQLVFSFLLGGAGAIFAGFMAQAGWLILFGIAFLVGAIISFKSFSAANKKYNNLKQQL